MYPSSVCYSTNTHLRAVDYNFFCMTVDLENGEDDESRFQERCELIEEPRIQSRFHCHACRLRHQYYTIISPKSTKIQSISSLIRYHCPLTIVCNIRCPIQGTKVNSQNSRMCHEETRFINKEKTLLNRNRTLCL